MPAVTQARTQLLTSMAITPPDGGIRQYTTDAKGQKSRNGAERAGYAMGRFFYGLLLAGFYWLIWGRRKTGSKTRTV